MCARSLGPGDGRIDAAFLRELIKGVPDLRYHLIDISVDLLQMAVRSVQDDPALEGVPIRAYLADFEKSLGTISLFLREENRRVLFLLTGFTLGNSREDSIVSAIESAMIEGDTLLVDTRLHRYGTLRGRKVMDLPRESVSELMRSYSSTAVYQFTFGPIEVATNFTIDPFDAQRAKIAFGTDPKIGYSAVPDALTVAITCQGIYNPSFEKFNRKVGLNSMQVVARGGKQIELAQVTFYDYAALCDWLGQRFTLRSLDAGSVGLFLVQR